MEVRRREGRVSMKTGGGGGGGGGRRRPPPPRLRLLRRRRRRINSIRIPRPPPCLSAPSGRALKSSPQSILPQSSLLRSFPIDWCAGELCSWPTARVKLRKPSTQASVALMLNSVSSINNNAAISTNFGAPSEVQQVISNRLVCGRAL